MDRWTDHIIHPLIILTSKACRRLWKGARWYFSISCINIIKKGRAKKIQFASYTIEVIPTKFPLLKYIEVIYSYILLRIPHKIP